MTTQKTGKRAVRSRMAKTGESDTGARRHLVEPSPMPPRAAAPPFSEAAVQRATGRGWDDWFRILDARDIEGFSHPETAAWLVTEHGLGGWWAQSVTVGYERARGLRQANQVAGGFSVGVTRTIPVPVDRVWAVVTDEAQRARWLGEGRLRARSERPGRTARFEDRDGRSRVSAYLTSKAPDRTTVTMQHDRLADAQAVEAMRAYWRERLDELARMLAEEA